MNTCRHFSPTATAAKPESPMSQPAPNVDEIVRNIAEKTDMSTEMVSKLYADTLADYRHDARVFDYVPLFAAKKVRATGFVTASGIRTSIALTVRAQEANSLYTAARGDYYLPK
ncbi:MAG: hypothetical protein CPDRYMAC_1182 [uncultured Paraburkholderia sp.]|nr:MAG: hypothetical protein CPDRYMAC_1182 [uncultured Paraburkholderia sp.]